MLTRSIRIFSVVTIAAGSLFLSATTASAENVSVRTLNKASRGDDPVASVMNLRKVCRTVKTVTGNEFLWKSEISNHITGGDLRRTGPTLVCNRICPASFPMPFYYSDGVQAGSVGYYGRFSGNGQPRAYCAAGGAPQCYISQIAKHSTTGGRDGFVYLRFSKNGAAAKDTVCYKVRPLGRTGGVS